MPVIAVRRLLAVLALAVAVAVVAAAPGGAQQTTSTKCTAYAVLKPGNEVRDPGSTDPTVESRATGAALVHIDGTRVTFTVAIANPARETFIAGHIHEGAAGVNGGIVVTLFGGSSDRRLFTQFDSITDEDAAGICGNLAGHYVNYHTTQDPQGAVRGQLIPLS
jgi:CHRD domain